VCKNTDTEMMTHSDIGYEITLNSIPTPIEPSYGDMGNLYVSEDGTLFECLEILCEDAPHIIHIPSNNVASIKKVYIGVKNNKTHNELFELDQDITLQDTTIKAGSKYMKTETEDGGIGMKFDSIITSITIMDESFNIKISDLISKGKAPVISMKYLSTEGLNHTMSLATAMMEINMLKAQIISINQRLTMLSFNQQVNQPNPFAGQQQYHPHHPHYNQSGQFGNHYQSPQQPSQYQQPNSCNGNYQEPYPINKRS
jgi:hypothetical protein